MLRGAALAEAEPALGSAARAGFLVERQWAVAPGQFGDTPAARLRRDGAELVEGARVTAGTYEADAVVIAAGVWSREVCASLGVRVEVAAGKGLRLLGAGRGTAEAAGAPGLGEGGAGIAGQGAAARRPRTGCP